MFKYILEVWAMNIFIENIKSYLWGQFLLRPSVALVVIFGLKSPTLEGKSFSSCHIRDDQLW